MRKLRGRGNERLLGYVRHALPGVLRAAVRGDVSAGPTWGHVSNRAVSTGGNMRRDRGGGIVGGGGVNNKSDCGLRYYVKFDLRWWSRGKTRIRHSVVKGTW